jgi:hypothetical protein
VALVEVVILFTIMKRRIAGLFNRQFKHAILKMLSATGFVGFTTYISVGFFPLRAVDQSFFAIFPKFMSIIGIAAVVYLICSKMMGIEEVNPVLRRMYNILFSGIRGKAS